MAQIINIDTEDDLDQVVTVTLESVVYTFRLRYNDRSNWQLSIYDTELYNIQSEDNSEAKLYGERRLMPNDNFLKYTNGSESLPTGYLYLQDTEYAGVQSYKVPDRYDLGQGKRFQLVYLTKVEYQTYIGD